MKRIPRAVVYATLLLIGIPTLEAQAPVATPAFSVADIHVRPRSSNPNPFMSGAILRGERYDIRNASMMDLITFAYDMDEETISGGPNWLDRDRFDIIAKAPAGTKQDVLKQMVRDLLAKRFKLTTHKETKPVPSFVLMVATGKHKMKEAAAAKEGDNCQPQQGNGPPAPGTIPVTSLSCRGVTMETFARIIRGWGGGYVTSRTVDQTALKGAFDFDLKWTPRNFVAQAGSEGSTLFAALEQQLGLKLEQQKLPTEVMVVDAVNNKPTDNPSGMALNLPPPPPAEFDVADIKLAAPDAQQNMRVLPSGQINMSGVTLKMLMTLAWDINDDELIANTPKWYDSTKYTIVAKTSTAVSTEGFDFDDLRLMLQALIKERFKLVTHVEDRPVTAYTLVADKPKLKPADPSNRTTWINGPAPGAKDPRDAMPILNRLITCLNYTMGQLAEDLARMANGYIKEPVVDATGLEGAFDFTLNFTGINRLGGPGGRGGGGDTGGAAGASDPSGGLSLFDAVQRQLGLKLELRKRPMPVLVIDKVEEKPID